MKGVVDSEDVPLNLSREHLQDSALIKRLSGVITRRIIKFLEKEAKVRNILLFFFLRFTANFQSFCALSIKTNLSLIENLLIRMPNLNAGKNFMLLVTFDLTRSSIASPC